MTEGKIRERRERLGKAISTLRKKQGLSQKMLGEMIGTQQCDIYRMEHGICSARIDRLIKVADALGVKVKELIDF